MTRNFGADINCSNCGGLISNAVPIPGTNQSAMNEAIEAQLETEIDGSRFFRCPDCAAKNEVQVITMNNGTGSRIVLTGEILQIRRIQLPNNKTFTCMVCKSEVQFHTKQPMNTDGTESVDWQDLDIAYCSECEGTIPAREVEIKDK